MVSFKNIETLDIFMKNKAFNKILLGLVLIISIIYIEQ